MRSDQGWSDVTIANVSSRGLLLQSTHPLQRNSFIEVRHRSVCIVGRVVWTHGSKCGVRTQDAIDIAGLLSHAPQKRRRAGEDRRTQPRRPEPRRHAAATETAEASKRFARLFDWTIGAHAACAAGAYVAQSAWPALDAPLAQATAALAHTN
jgi:hypothetical protein